MNDKNRVLGRALAIEETRTVSGAKSTSPIADTKVDVNGNADTTTMIDTTSPITD